MPSPRPSSPQSVYQKVLAVTELLCELDMTTMDYLVALFWGDSDCRADERLKNLRRSFNTDPRLSQLLRTMHKPPRLPGSGKQVVGARDQLESFAFSCVMAIFQKELANYQQILSANAEPPEPYNLKEITLPSIFHELNHYTPRLFASMQELAQTVQQQRRNTRKSPETISAIIVNIVVFSRSQRQGKLQKLLSLFFKAEGLPVRAFDILNAFGLSMSRAWVDRAVLDLAESSMSEVREAVLMRPVCIPSDNLRIESHVDSQRLTNKSMGVNCTSMCVVELPKRLFDILHSTAFHSAQRALNASGKPKLISWADIINLPELDTIHTFSRYLVLRALLDLPELSNHPLASNVLIQRPAPISPLTARRTKFWALGTVPIDQGSYEGSALVVDEVMKQLGLDSNENQQRLATQAGLPFAGDLLTCQRLKGLRSLRSEDDNGYDRLDWLLPTHGFFHNRMNLQYAIYNNHRGNSAGDGFAREINVLKRHGLSATTKHPNVHTVDEFLHHFWIASTLDNWMWATKTTTVDKLIEWALRITDPQVLVDLAGKIVAERQSSAALATLDHISSTPETPSPNSNPAVDERLRARIMCNRDLLLSEVERDAIRHGDVGLLDNLVALLAIFFKGGGHGNYGNDLLKYIQWKNYESTPALRDLVRHCWLVNTQGRPDSFLPIDELQEHFNREQREWHTRVGANFSFDLLKRTSPAIPTLAEILKHVSENFELPYRSHAHKSPDAQRDIRVMAHRFRSRAVSDYVPGRTISNVQNRPSDYINSGTEILQKPSTLTKVFTDRMMYLDRRSQAQEFDTKVELELVGEAQKLCIDDRV